MNETAIFLPIAVSIATVFALPLIDRKFRTRLAHDPVEAVMFGAAAVLSLAILFSAAIVIQTHDIAILKVVMFATGAFAFVGIAFGLFRSLRKPAR